MIISEHDEEKIEEILGWHGADISEDVANDIVHYLRTGEWTKNDYTISRNHWLSYEGSEC